MKKLYQMFYREFRIFGSGNGESYKNWREVCAGEAAFESFQKRHKAFTGWV